MIQPNASISSIAIPSGHDGERAEFQALAIASPIPCQIETLSNMRIQTLQSEGVSATRSVEVLAGEIEQLTDADLDGAIVGLTITRRGQKLAADYIVTMTDEPAGPTIGQATVVLLCRPSASDVAVAPAEVE